MIIFNVMLFFVSSFVFACFFNAKENVPLFEGEHVKLVSPALPLAKGAIKIESKWQGRHFVDWTRQENIEAYQLMQKIIGLWEKQGIANYLILGRENQSTFEGFAWEMVPFSTHSFALEHYWKQIEVIARIFLGYGVTMSAAERLQQHSDFQHYAALLSAPLADKDEHSLPSNDAFCLPKVINAQALIDAPEKSVRVLYDYKPLTKYHFLIVTKAHQERFSDVTQESYVQASEYAQQLIKKFGKAEETVYLHHKTGKEAGQTVPHWHMHVALPQAESQLGKICRVLYNLVRGVMPLKPAVLKARVDELRTELERT